MFITSSFKKSLIVEEFQGNYLKLPQGCGIFCYFLPCMVQWGICRFLRAVKTNP